jgi:alpha/beta hydrolase fold
VWVRDHAALVDGRPQMRTIRAIGENIARGELRDYRLSVMAMLTSGERAFETQVARTGHGPFSDAGTAAHHHGGELAGQPVVLAHKRGHRIPCGASMWKWIRRSSLSAVGLLGLAQGAGMVYDQWGRWNTARVYPPPGDLVEFDGARSHLHCVGHGSPTVLLEAGLDPSGSFSWRRVLPDIAVTTRVCAYDRAGILWSEPRPGPRDAHRIADELHALLAAASEPPPYVMVGHSFGGLLVRVFDRRFKGEVVGFVLVDSCDF